MEEKFRIGFIEKGINKGISVVKSESKQDNEVQAITGATVSSKAIGAGVNAAITFYMKTVKGVDFNLEQNDATSGASEAGAGTDPSEGTPDETAGASEGQ
jgi:electron transport complex protein RnfG